MDHSYQLDQGDFRGQRGMIISQQLKGSLIYFKVSEKKMEKKKKDEFIVKKTHSFCTLF
jgi:hypothetical protein